MSKSEIFSTSNLNKNENSRLYDKEPKTVDFFLQRSSKTSSLKERILFLNLKNSSTFSLPNIIVFLLFIKDC